MFFSGIFLSFPKSKCDIKDSDFYYMKLYTISDIRKVYMTCSSKNMHSSSDIEEKITPASQEESKL